MVVNVAGSRGGKIAQDLYNVVYEAANSFALQLDIHRLQLLLNIRIHHKSMIDNFAEAYCECITPREYNIDIALYSNWMATLAHEMVHVKQFARGELSSDMRKWMKKAVDDMEYYDQPWEKEAFSRQYDMVKVFENRPI